METMNPSLEGLGIRPESEKQATSRVVLHFRRHGDKEKDPSKTDQEIRLTPTGRQQALAASENNNLSQAVAFGSPRERAQETAGMVMAGLSAELTGDETLEELREKLDADLKGVGTKIGVDERLDFILEDGTPYGDQANAAYKQGELLKFLVEKSDQLAAELQDTKSLTYTRGAAEIAEIVAKYATIAERWNRLVAEDMAKPTDERKGYTDTLERFFGSHQTVTEVFLAKVIEKTKGIEERNKFVEALRNNGFDFVEGYDVEVRNGEQGQPTIHISYHKKEGDRSVYDFEEDIPLTTINEIVQEGQALQ